jgi:cytochrome b
MAQRNRRTVMYLPMRVWDAPIRLFHWLLVALLPVSYFTGRAHAYALHKPVGYALLGLLLFRLVWGLIGSDTARFARFVTSPIAGLRHLRRFGVREPDTQIGHNAAGGWMVLLLLLLLVLQVGSGLGAYSSRAKTGGPLAAWIGEAASHKVSMFHAFNVNIILAAIALHLVAVLAYALVKKQDLVLPMITGKKRLPAATPAPRLASPLLAAAVAVAAAAAAWLVATQL